MKTKLVFLFLIGASSLAFAGPENLDITGNSEFIATGKPGFIKIDGKGTGVKGSFKVNGNLVSGDASFPLSTLDSGVPIRDEHMRDNYLEVKKFPDAKLIIKDVKMPTKPTADGFSKEKVPFDGTMTVHGVTHSVSGTIDLSTKGGVTKGDAQFGIKISQFGFPEPKFMGMKVNDDVLVKVHIEAKKAKAG